MGVGEQCLEGGHDGHVSWFSGEEMRLPVEIEAELFKLRPGFMERHGTTCLGGCCSDNARTSVSLGRPGHNRSCSIQ